MNISLMKSRSQNGSLRRIYLAASLRNQPHHELLCPSHSKRCRTLSRTLQLSAWQLEQQVLQRLTVNFAHISAECIRLLRDRVENEASRVALGVSDQTISTVATLAAIEVCYSSVET